VRQRHGIDEMRLETWARPRSSIFSTGATSASINGRMRRSSKGDAGTRLRGIPGRADSWPRSQSGSMPSTEAYLTIDMAAEGAGQADALDRLDAHCGPFSKA